MKSGDDLKGSVAQPVGIGLLRIAVLNFAQNRRVVDRAGKGFSAI